MAKQHQERVLSQREQVRSPSLAFVMGSFQESWGWMPRVNWSLTQSEEEESCEKNAQWLPSPLTASQNCSHDSKKPSSNFGVFLRLLSPQLRILS